MNHIEILVTAVVAVVVAYGHPTNTSPDAPAHHIPLTDAALSSDAPAAAISCTAVDSSVAVQHGVHGIYAVPGVPALPYLLSAADVCGGDLYVDWSAVDSGSGAYDWGKVEAQITPWTSAGKRVNLLVEAVGFGSANTTTPAYVLSQVPTVSCTQTSPVPVFWNATYMQLYQTFMAAVVAKYGGDSRIGYIRLGLSNGAQAGTTVCYDQLVTAGLTLDVWETYVQAMASHEATLAHSVQLMLALGPFGDPNAAPDPTFPDWEAGVAVALGLGIGNQGLHAADITAYQSNMPCTGGDWCRNFANPSYIGKVPFYMQQVAPSCPDNSCATGSLTTILPFAVSLHTQVLEVYADDLGIAYDSTNASYPQYGSGYRALFDQLAAQLGTAP